MDRETIGRFLPKGCSDLLGAPRRLRMPQTPQVSRRTLRRESFLLDYAISIVPRVWRIVLLLSFFFVSRLA